MKKFLSVCLSLLMAFCALPAGVAFAAGESTIRPGEIVTVTLDHSGDVYNLMFTPERTGEYRIQSHLTDDIVDPYCIVNDSEGNEIVSADEGWDAGENNVNFDVTKTFTAGEKYTIRCQSMAITSAVSYLVELTEVDPPQPPASPTGLAAMDITMTSFRLDWNDVEDAEKYIVYDPSTDPVRAVEVTDSEYIVSGLSADTEYTVRVFAVNDFGRSAAAQLKVRTLAEKPEEPQEPEKPAGTKPTSPNGYNVYARGDGGTDLYLEWNKVAAADGYRVYIISGDKEILKGTATTNRFTFTDLVPSWEYRVMVVAFNEYGTSASKTTVCAAPSQVKNVKANASGNRITASWSSTTSHGYLIQWSKNSNFSTVAGSAEISGSDKTSYTINVNNAQDYYVRVRAWKNYAGSKVYGDFSTPSRAAEKPGAPNGYNVYARGDGGTDLYLEWNKVSNADGYRVYIISGDKEILKGTTNSNRFTFTDLVPSWEYRVMVVAFNENGSASSKTTVCAAPSQVKNVKANASGNRITASWSSTTSHGYLIQWSTSSNFSTVAGSAVISGSGKTNYTINVSNAKNYYVRVRAWKNFNGSTVYGDFSKPAAVD